MSYADTEALKRLKTTSGDVACSTVKSGIPENMGIAVGISSIAALEPEIC